MDLLFIENLLNANYDIRFGGISVLRDGPGFVCTVYGGKRKFVVKNYRTAYIERGIQSVEIMSYLNQAGYPVPAVIPTNRGLPYFYYEYENENRIGALFEFVKGFDPYHVAPKDASTIGACVAEMHGLMRKYTGKVVSYGRSYFIDAYIQKLNEKKYPEAKIKEFADYGNALWEKVKDLPKGFCHGDLHTGNMILTPARDYVIVDFDLASYSFPSHDIMTICDRTHYFDFKPSGMDRVTRMLEGFSKGYCPVGSMREKEISAVYPFIAIRHFQLQAVVLDVFGLDCVDEGFLDKQLDWIRNWCDQCAKRNLLTL